MNLWENTPATPKAVLLDDRMSIVGSYNLDMRTLSGYRTNACCRFKGIKCHDTKRSRNR